MRYDFDKQISRRGTDCIKYDLLTERYGRDDLTPLWVADMDFETPDFIVEAIRKRCEHPVFGYTFPSEDYYSAIINWLENLHEWRISREWLTFVPGIVRGIAYVTEHFSEKGDKIIIQPPVYHPFRLVPQDLGREVVYNPLKMNAQGEYEMDFDNLESIIDAKCKVLILSSPHNPAGIVWKKETLRQLAAICFKHNIIVVSDEIHAEMAYPGFTHHPFPTVSDEAAACSITFMAPSKTFNIAGLIASYAIVPDKSLRDKFYGFLRAGEFNEGSLFSYAATVAAYTQGFEWRLQMLDYVIRNVYFVDEFLTAELPQIKVYMPQASFLVWLDCRRTGLSQHGLNDLFTNRAHLALNDGVIFGKEGEGYMRLNVGCPRQTLEKAVVELKNCSRGR
ncbi:MAG: PatB family C-S lyase [Tannerella sp.]|jgi:cystathionine beta-lyase|nr:PatB family C-S lyase [Tannerella sp.]